MAEATLKLLLLGDDRTASKALKNVGDNATKTESHTRRLGASFAKVGKAAAVGLAAGMAVAGAAMVGMVKNAAEDQAAQRRLAVALRNTTGATKDQVKSVEDWISKQGVALGVTDDELRPAFQRLVQATGSITKAQKLAGIAMDASAGSGKSLKVVSEAISKAHNGNLGALSRLGIKIKDADGKTLSFNEAMKEMGKTFKGQASEGANTFDGKMGRLKVMFDETKETIGGALIPVLTKLAGWFLNLVKGMQDGTGAGGTLKNIFSGIGDVVKVVGNFIGHDLVPFIKDMADRFRDAMGGGDGFKKSLNDMRPAINLVKTVLGVLWAGIKWAMKAVIPVAVAQFKLMAKVIGTLGAAATWLWNNAFQPAIKFIVKGISWLMDKFGDMLAALGKVPGFGWAKDAAEKLHNAAKKANDLANGIRDIPKNTTVNIKVKTKYTDNKGPGSADVQPGYSTPRKNRAVGTNYAAGGRYWVGERGPEMVTLARGSRVDTAQASARMMGGAGGGSVMGQIEVVLRGEDGRVIERKLADVRRKKGRELEFQR